MEYPEINREAGFKSVRFHIGSNGEYICRLTEFSATTNHDGSVFIKMTMPLCVGMVGHLTPFLHSVRNDSIITGAYVSTGANFIYTSLKATRFEFFVEAGDCVNIIIDLSGSYQENDCGDVKTNNFLGPERIVTWNDALCEVYDSSNKIVINGMIVRKCCFARYKNGTCSKISILGSDLDLLSTGQEYLVKMGYRLSNKDDERSWCLKSSSLMVDQKKIIADNTGFTTSFSLVSPD